MQPRIAAGAQGGTCGGGRPGACVRGARGEGTGSSSSSSRWVSRRQQQMRQQQQQQLRQQQQQQKMRQQQQQQVRQQVRQQQLGEPSGSSGWSTGTMISSSSRRRHRRLTGARTSGGLHADHHAHAVLQGLLAQLHARVHLRGHASRITCQCARAHARVCVLSHPPGCSRTRCRVGAAGLCWLPCTDLCVGPVETWAAHACRGWITSYRSIPHVPHSPCHCSSPGRPSVPLPCAQSIRTL